MRQGFFVVVSAAFLSACPMAVAECPCLHNGPLAALKQQAMSAAYKLPSEADRGIARNFRSSGLPKDAGQWYRTASAKAVAEVDDLRNKLSQSPSEIDASELKETSSHSASIHREAASFFNQQGDAAAAAQNWELAIIDELMTSDVKSNHATEYGTVARLYEQAGNHSKAAEMFKKQADLLAAKHGRYNDDTKFAMSEYNRVIRRTQQISSRPNAHR